MAFRDTFPSLIHGLTDQELTLLPARVYEPFMQIQPLSEMPDRADLLLHLDTSHQIDTLRINNWPADDNSHLDNLSGKFFA